MELEYKLAYKRLLKAIKSPDKQVSVRRGVLHFQNQPERSKREDLTSLSPLPEGLAERLWKMGNR